ncbi:MAG: hypothetical protein ABEI06_07360, partial [Halobacteriaceae archaeon]
KQMVVHIHEVQEPKDFEGWGYQVLVEEPRSDKSTTREEELGIYEDLNTARNKAFEYMENHTK